MHFSMLRLERVARVGPADDNGNEIQPNINFEHVMPFAHLSEKDCPLTKLIDGL